MKRIKRAWLALLFAWAVWQAFNIFAGIEGLLELSASIHWLHGWWNFATFKAFQFLGVELSPILRNIAILTGLALTVSNIALFMDGKRSVFELAYYAVTNTKRAIHAMAPSVKGFELVLGALGFGMLVGSFVGEANLRTAYGAQWLEHAGGVMLTLYLGVGFMALALVPTVEGEYQKDAVQFGEGSFFDSFNPRTAKLIAIFAVLFGFVPFAIFKYRKTVFKVCVYLILFVLADLFFTHIFDPIAPWLAELPPPPSEGGND